MDFWKGIPLQRTPGLAEGFLRASESHFFNCCNVVVLLTIKQFECVTWVCTGRTQMQSNWVVENKLHVSNKKKNKQKLY